MHLLESARRPTSRLRVALATLLLAFALNSIAHVSHRHDAAAAAAAAHGVVCGYCASFGGLASAPRHAYAISAATRAEIAIVAPSSVIRPIERLTSARPRAPPVS